MKISLLDNIEAFEGIKEAWDDIFENDPDCSIFCSWAWFNGWLRGTPFLWKILAVQKSDTGDYIAFFPIGFRERRNKKIKFIEIFIGGNPSSDHTGFICLPEYRDSALDLLVTYLTNKIKWDVFRLEDVFDRKVEILISELEKKNLLIIKKEGNVCPYIDLPESWEIYLQNSRKKTRKYFRRYCRYFDESKELRFEYADNENFSFCLTVFLEFYRKRWPHLNDKSIERKKKILISCFNEDILKIAMLFYKDIPIACRITFIDKKNKNILFYNIAHNKEYDDLSPGAMINCAQIKDAINWGYVGCDFLRGEESYKYDFYRARKRINKDVFVYRKNLKNLFERYVGNLNLPHCKNLIFKMAK